MHYQKLSLVILLPHIIDIKLFEIPGIYIKK